MVTLTFSKQLVKKLIECALNAQKFKNVHAYRLAIALLWYSEGRSIQEIAKLLMISTKTVFTWIKKFMSGGIEWIKGQHFHGRGRKEKLTKVQKKQLYKMIVDGPEKNWFTCGIWNSAMIRELILIKFGVFYNLNYLPSLLKKMGLSYQKARFMSDRHDEKKYENARKEWLTVTLPALMKKAKEDNAIILFGDEVSFAMWGSLARTWSPAGQQPTVKTRGIRKGLKMFGTIELAGGSFQYRQLLSFSFQAKSLKLLKSAGVPKDVLDMLIVLKGSKHATESDFLIALQATIGKDLTDKYQSVILKSTETSGKFNGQSYIEFLQQLLDHYKGKIFLIEDGASYHGSKVVTAFKEINKDRLTVTRLPAYSPDYNPIEKLWKNTKRDATHLKYFKTFADLCASVEKTFKSYMEDASKVICVMAKMRNVFINM